MRVRVLHIVRDLGSLGVDRTVAGLAMSADRREFQPAVVSLQGRESASRIEAAGVPVVHLNQQARFDWKLFPRLRQALLDFAPHVVHTYGSALRHTWPVTSLANPRPVHVHTISGEPDRLSAWLFRHSVTAVSASAAAAGALHIPTGIVLPELSQRSGNAWRDKEGFASTDLLIGCPDRFEASAHHNVLLEAFAKVASTGAKLLLTGEGPLKDVVRAQVHSHGLAKQVLFLGGGVETFAQVDALASASTGDEWLMEAMAFGKACAAACPALLEDNRSGLVVKLRDVGSLAEALARLVDSPHLRERLGYAARERAVAEFDHRKMVRAYEGLYRRLLTEKRIAA